MSETLHTSLKWIEETPVEPGIYCIKLWEQHLVKEKYEYRETTGYVEIKARNGELDVIDGYPGAAVHQVWELNDFRREWLGPLPDNKDTRARVIKDRVRTIAIPDGQRFYMNFSVEYK